MTDPYRERPPMLECPRCGEVLADVTSGVAMCARCGGIWLAQRAVNAAFRDPTWPHGIGMWWRRELPCPQCAVEGTDGEMSTVTVGDLMLDRCVEHGLWLDRGELARLVGGSPAKELDWLKDLLASDQRPGGDPPAPSELDAYRADVAAREQAELERARREEEQEAKRSREEATRRKQERILELRVLRNQSQVEIEDLVARLRTHREQIAADEEKLGRAREQFRRADEELAKLEA